MAGASSTYSRIPSTLAAVSVYVANETGSFLWRNIGRTVVVRFQLVTPLFFPSLSLSLSLSPLLSASMSPCSFLETCRFFTNTQHRRTKEALYLGKRWEPETFCYIVSIYRYPFRENCRVTGEFVARIDNRRTLRKIRLKRVIRRSKLSVVVLNLVSSCWKSFLSFLFLYSVIIHSRSFAFFVVYLFPVSGSKVKLKI